MNVKHNRTSARAFLLIGLLMILIMFQVQQPEARIILLLSGSMLLGIGRYKYYQAKEKEQEIIKYSKAA